MKQQTKTTDPDILLIEDNDDDAEIVHSIYKKNKIENILHVKSGEEALDYLFSKNGGSTLNPSPKLVLLDINLPGMNGLTILRRMRANYKTQNLPVFVFTSFASHYNIHYAYKYGVTSYISKHTSYEKLEEAILQTEIYLQRYKVLILEDNVSDAEIISYELESSHLDCVCRIAKNKAEYVQALMEFKPDIVFSDYDLTPNFDAIQAQRLLKETNPEIPFVLITGKLAEEFASGYLVEGMDDYLLKGQLRRLPLTLIDNVRKKFRNNELIKKLQKSEEELKNKSFILSEAQSIARIGNWKFDIASGKMTWSDEMYKIYGVSKDTFLHIHDAFVELVHPDDKESVKHCMEGVITNLKRCDLEFRIIFNDGTIRFISVSGEPFYDEKGEFVSLIGTAQDITRLKETEEENRMANQRLNYHLNNSPLAIIEWDKNFIIREWSVQAQNIFGWSKPEVLNKHFNDLNLVFEEDVPDAAVIAGELMTGTVISNKSVNRSNTKSGKVITCQWFNSVLKDEIGNILSIQSLVLDITENKANETGIREALGRYDILAQATSDTIWDWHIVNNKMLYNDGITKMFGYKATEVENVVDWWNEKLHSDDFKTVKDSLEDIFEKGEQRLQLTYRFRCADGSYKHIFDRAFVLFDENGKPIRMIGAMQDISYQVEEEIRVAKAILDAHEEERNYLGAELHDNINQILAGTLLTLGMAKSKEVDTTRQTGFINSAMGYITDAINETRKLSHHLAPVRFEDNSLKDLFENLLLNINLENLFTTRLQFDELKEIVLPENMQVNLYRILQEQTKNILKYAEATIIEIAVTFSDKAVNLRIYDNGKGFNTKTSKKGIGLSNIKKRAESLNGKFILNSAPGKGCEIIVEIPLAC